MTEEQRLQKVDAGSSDCIPTQAGSVKKGGYCMLKGFPCKVSDSSAKPGKHGSAKASIVGNDIFTGKKYEESMPTAATALIPIVNNYEYEVVDIDEDDFVSLLLPNGELKADLKLPAGDEEVYKQLKAMWESNKDIEATILFTIISAVKQEKIISGRVTQ